MTHAITIDEELPGCALRHQRHAAPGQFGLNNPTDTFLPESVPDTGPDNSFQHMGSFTIRSTCGATLARVACSAGQRLAIGAVGCNRQPGMQSVSTAKPTPGIV
jgi:hypothetical protein